MAAITRRQALVASGAALVGAIAGRRVEAAPQSAGRVVTKRRLRQSVCRGPYRSIALPDFARACADMGLSGTRVIHRTRDDHPVASTIGMSGTSARAAER